jgi:cytochrome c oxidase assembly factor CtaG
MTLWKLFTITWNWQSSVVVGSLALLLGYVYVVRTRWTRRSWLFVAGVLIMMLDLVSPLDTLGDIYLFSAHMAEHLFLIWVVPPLLLLGTPPWLARNVLKQPFFDRTERFLRRAPVAWLIGNAAVWLWHAPFLYNAALANEDIHTVEHLSFLVSATILWWPGLAPSEERRLPPLIVILYLFTTGVSMSILGIIETYAPPGAYPAYLHPLDEYGVLTFLRETLGLTPKVDQQWGGLLMWVPGSVVYLIASLAALARWYREPEEKLIDSGTVSSSASG